jgi:hypothetical protein
MQSVPPHAEITMEGAEPCRMFELLSNGAATVGSSLEGVTTEVPEFGPGEIFTWVVMASHVLDAVLGP